MPESKRGGI
jgi:hypothetical protein